MKNYFVGGLVFVVLTFASIGQAFASGSPGFSLTSSCDIVQYRACGPAIITVASLNGFSGTVSLSTTVTPYCTSCFLRASMNPSSVTVTAGGNATSMLRLSYTCSQTPYCAWDVTITGISGSTTNSTDVFVCDARPVCPH